MEKKINILTVVGTRPEIIRLSRIISKLNESEIFNHVLVHTGQNYDYELNKIFFENLKLSKPDYFLESAKNTPAETIAEIIAKVDKVFSLVNPDALLVLGDTNSCLSAYSAKRRKIPIFHMEAGNRCFDDRVPEEINRKIVDHISDINMPYSSISREYLIREGIKPDRIIKTGSPMREVLQFFEKNINKSKILEDLKLKRKNYFVVSCHREENIDDDFQFQNLIEILNKTASKYKKEIIFSTHPRTMKKLKKEKLKLSKRVKILKPFGFFDYIKLQKNSILVMSDSGTISEESSILRFPAINIRRVHERPEAMEEGAVIMTGLDWKSIHSSQKYLIDNFEKADSTIAIPNDYKATNVSDKVIKIILSYYKYVDHFVWHKN
ncbi:MAG: UDP-N-acetylglucosamine 2-epimerase (non-hydrolyzing) [Legionellales bacterium]|nr:UDP-N-acetylglucosamine 2-epimerase (non-hydrolyzing) [Legionellales bacterium]